MEEKILQLLQEIKKQNKKNTEDIITAIKKNRTTIIKKAFDKSMLSPMLESNVEMMIKIQDDILNSKIDITRTMDSFYKNSNKRMLDGLKYLIKLFE